MTRWLHAAALGLAAWLLVPVSAYAQSLADVAAREKERRAGQGQKVKSYSEDDLGAGGAISSFETTSDDSGAPGEGAAPAEGATAEEGAGEGSPQQEASAPKEKSEDEQRAEQRKAWNEKLQKAQADLNGSAAEMEKLQRGLNDLTGNYYNPSRTEMLNRMEALKKQNVAAKEALDAVVEEGRRNRF